MVKISIISIGDEITIGQVINSNSAWIAKECTKIGGYITNQSVVRDMKEDLISVLKQMSQKNDVIITTGGLGPTHDDITKETLLEFFDDELIFNEIIFNKINELFARSNRQITERNKSQAFIPSKSNALPNDLGTAPGLYFKLNAKHYFALPGVPAEMMSIMTNSVIPIILNLIEDSQEDIIIYRTIHTTGIFESFLADLLGNPEEFIGDGTLAFLPSYRGVRMRIGVTQPDYASAISELDRIEAEIFKRAGKYVISTDDKPLSQVAGKYLKDLGATVSVAESCTAGMLGAAITEVPGSSQYFVGGVISYSNEMKINILKVSNKTIEQFGAVSKETAIEMAENVRKIFNTDYGISITGIAGPDGGTDEKPVGTVWISIADRYSSEAFKYIFSIDRAVNRERSVGTALSLLMKKLIKRHTDNQ